MNVSSSFTLPYTSRYTSQISNNLFTLRCGLLNTSAELHGEEEEISDYNQGTFSEMNSDRCHAPSAGDKMHV